MRRPHVAEIVSTTQLKCADVFDDPSFTHTINLSATQHADAAGFLPHLKPTVRRELPAERCGHIFDLDEWHSAPHSPHE
ncbi:hypothetical protein [Microvirga vignae]|uniref:hypothetical protein n=1 Tax=Microvirga vignae TaxID=1225564 RepID=UPI001FCDC01D|nr:hypothetical protein [Microvirga vignae]